MKYLVIGLWDEFDGGRFAFEVEASSPGKAEQMVMAGDFEEADSENMDFSNILIAAVVEGDCKIVG